MQQRHPSGQASGQDVGTPLRGDHASTTEHIPSTDVGSASEVIDVGAAGAEPHPPRSWSSLRRWAARIVVLVLCVAVGVVVAGGNWAFQQTQEVPDFYRNAALVNPSESEAVSHQLESEVEQLAQRVGQLGSWQANFSEAEINAWLIHELPREFVRVLPRGVSDPRVAIRDGRILAAARYENKRINTVVSFEVTAKLTEEPNVLAFEISNLKAGALPLPLGRFIDHISRRAARGALEVRWDETERGDYVALVTVPSEHPQYVRKPVIVESVSITEGEIRLAGHTGPDARISYQPQTAVYQLASYRTKSELQSESNRDRQLKRAL